MVLLKTPRKLVTDISHLHKHIRFNPGSWSYALSNTFTDGKFLAESSLLV